MYSIVPNWYILQYYQFSQNVGFAFTQKSASFEVDLFLN